LGLDGLIDKEERLAELTVRIVVPAEPEESVGGRLEVA
jgi:hypothetical protein